MKKHKKLILMASLVLALSAAVYLNWSMTQPTSKILGESKFVSATMSTQSTPDEAKQTSAKVSNLTEKQQNFFAKAKTERDQIQDEIIDTASEKLNLENTSEADRNEAQNQVAGIIKNFTVQNSVETTLKAKAFSECLCYINEQGCVVTVPKSELNDSTSMIIKSTVQSMTNMGFDKITVVTV